jgi:hypothetical protein
MPFKVNHIKSTVCRRGGNFRFQSRAPSLTPFGAGPPWVQKCQKETFPCALARNGTTMMVAVDQSRRSGRKTWAVSLKISRSAAPELISFGCLHCYFLVILCDISIALCRKKLKNTNASNELRLVICKSMRSRMCELTHPETGSTMAVSSSICIGIGERPPFEKDNGHTEF